MHRACTALILSPAMSHRPLRLLLCIVMATGAASCATFGEASSTPVTATEAPRRVRRAAPSGRAFRCTSEVAPVRVRHDWNAMPAGRLEVQRVASTAATPSGSSPAPTGLEAHVRVVAEGTTLAAFGAALSVALGIGVVVEDDLVGVRVGLALPDVDVPRLRSILIQSYGVYTSMHDGALHFSTDPRAVWGAETDLDQPMPFVETGSLESRWVPSPASFSSEQLAQLFCAHYASARGDAVAGEGGVVVRDAPDRIAALERALGSMTPH